MNKEQEKKLLKLEKQLTIFIINNDIDTILNYPAFALAGTAIDAIRNIAPIKCGVKS